MELSSTKRQLLTTFRPKKKPELELEVYSMVEEDFEDIGMKCAKIFYDYEPVCGAVDVTLEELYRDVHIPILRKGIKDNLAIVARNKANNEFVGTIWAEDFFELDPIPDGCHENNLEIFRFLEHLEHKGFETLEKPKVKNEMVHVVIVCLNMDYGGLDITTELTNYLMFEHPIAKNAKIFFTEATNGRSARMFEKCGYKSLFTCNYGELDPKEFPKIHKADDRFRERGMTHGKALEFMTWTR